jgi:hypothetical protein
MEALNKAKETVINGLQRAHELVTAFTRKFRGQQALMYEVHEEAVRHYNQEHQEKQVSEAEKLRVWDQVFVKKMFEGNCRISIYSHMMIEDSLTFFGPITEDEDKKKSIDRSAMFISDAINDRDIYHKTDNMAVSYVKLINIFILIFKIILDIQSQNNPFNRNISYYRSFIFGNI